MCAKKDATKDMLGTEERYRARVAVKVKDLVRLTDREVKSKGFDLVGKAIKNPEQADIEKLRHMAESSDFSSGASPTSRMQRHVHGGGKEGLGRAHGPCVPPGRIPTVLDAQE